MSAPTAKLRAAVYLRDGFLCISCGSFDNLTFQHREASGSGGRGPKAPELTTADGCTLCNFCNMNAEAAGQTRALALGHKIRRNRGKILSSEIPVYDHNHRAWFLLDTLGGRSEINPFLAAELIEAAGGMRQGLAS